MRAPNLSTWAPRTAAQWAKAISNARWATIASAAMFWIGLIVFGVQIHMGTTGHATLGSVALAAAGFIESTIGFVWYWVSAIGGWTNPRKKVGMVEAPAVLQQNVHREIEKAASAPTVVSAVKRIPKSGPLYQADMLDLLAALQARRHETETSDARRNCMDAVREIAGNETSTTSTAA